MGLVVPLIRVRDNLDLKPNTYRITLKGVEIGSGEVRTGMFLAIDPGTIQSGYCIYDGTRVRESGVLPNAEMLAHLQQLPAHRLAIGGGVESISKVNGSLAAGGGATLATDAGSSATGLRANTPTAASAAPTSWAVSPATCGP